MGHGTKGCGNVCLRTFGKCDWDIGPRGAEIFFSLPLRLVHWLVGPAGDGINDIYRASDRVVDSFWTVPGSSFGGGGEVGGSLLCG